MGWLLLKLVAIGIALEAIFTHLKVALHFQLLLYCVYFGRKTRKMIEVVKDVGMIGVVLATTIVPDIEMPDYGYISDIVDVVCNSSIAIIGVLVAYQIWIKYKHRNEKRKLAVENDKLDLEIKRKQLNK